MLARLLAALLCLGLLAAAAPLDHAERIASLIDRATLATLGQRAANPRVQKVYWLAVARAEGQQPVLMVDRPVAEAGYKDLAATLTRDALLRNLDIAEKLRCLDAAGLGEMRRGKAPTVMRGPYTGDQLSVDHIIPRAVVPELDNVIANLELMPLRLNNRKNSHMGQRQRDLAQRLFEAGLLSREGRERVVR
jgi:hypothetical protein